MVKLIPRGGRAPQRPPPGSAPGYENSHVSFGWRRILVVTTGESRWGFRKTFRNIWVHVTIDFQRSVSHHRIRFSLSGTDDGGFKFLPTIANSVWKSSVSRALGLRRGVALDGMRGMCRHPVSFRPTPGGNPATPLRSIPCCFPTALVNQKIAHVFAGCGGALRVCGIVSKYRWWWFCWSGVVTNGVTWNERFGQHAPAPGVNLSSEVTPKGPKDDDQCGSPQLATVAFRGK